MSIIHEALKKVQQTTSPGQPPRSPAVPPGDNATTPSSTAPAPAVPTPLTISLLTVLGTAIFIILVILIKLAVETTQHPRLVSSQQKNAVPLQTEQAPPPAPTAPTPAATPTTKPTASEDPFRIEGIMDMGNKKVALINGNVYEEGQSVNGLLIVGIELNQITVMDNGARRVIPTRP